MHRQETPILIRIFFILLVSNKLENKYTYVRSQGSHRIIREHGYVFHFAGQTVMHSSGRRLSLFKETRTRGFLAIIVCSRFKFNKMVNKISNANTAASRQHDHPWHKFPFFYSCYGEVAHFHILVRWAVFSTTHKIRPENRELTVFALRLFRLTVLRPK